MEICKRCKYESTCSAASESDFCLNYEPRLLTNADSIRSMADEELAEWFSIYCCRNKTYDANCDEFGNCKSCWLDWLKEEAKE